MVQDYKYLELIHFIIIFPFDSFFAKLLQLISLFFIECVLNFTSSFGNSYKISYTLSFCSLYLQFINNQFC